MMSSQRRSAGLAPRWRDRIWLAAVGRRRGGRASRVARRALALVLVVIAGIIALGPRRAAEPGSPVLVLTRDLPIGATIAVAGSAIAIGRVLAGPTRRGEVLTDVRLAGTVGPDPGPGRVAVPVRPADPAVVDLLGTGMHVAVIAVDEDGSAELLAPDAVVLSIVAESARGRGDRPVVLAVPAETADRIAATALTGTIAVRFT